MILRDYQIQAINACRAAFRSGSRRILLVAPTGAGKTAIASEIVRSSISAGNRVLFVAHRRELIEQTSNRLGALGIPHGLILSGESADSGHHVQVASIQTLIRRQLPGARVLIFDEAHLSLAASFVQVASAYPDAALLGLTATPCRLDGRGLGNLYQSLVEVETTAGLIERGFLVPPRHFAPSSPDLGSVAVRRGDYASDNLDAACNRADLVGDIVAHYKRLAYGRRAIAFAVSVAHSRHIAAQFIAANIPAAHIDGTTPADERRAILDRLRSGDLWVVTNCGILAEGFDLPALDALILARPTKSMALYLQQAGRALRTSPGKSDAIILDHAGLALEHGLITESREWSLTSPRRERCVSGVSVRICHTCFAAIKSAASRCEYCGTAAPPPTTTRSGPTTDDGQLEELRAVARAKQTERRAARTLPELIALGVSRGYRNPTAWARAVFNGRQR